jgi:hypothetical protein
MKKLAAALLTAMAMAAAPVVAAPAAPAEPCKAVHTGHIAAGGCTDATGNAVLLVPENAGDKPCYTPDGQPYYTRDGDRC